ncbi:MAG: adenylyl-sulfate kinase, partial [Hyphomicrobiaceae bacterium]
ANKLGFEGIRCIPVVARAGDNIVHRSTNMSWYTGPTLQAHLDSVDARQEETFSDMVMPVQWVNRPTSDFRGYSGSLASGTVKVGDGVVVLPAGKSSRVQRIFNSGRDSCAARLGEAVTLTLEDEIDVCRGDVIAAAAERLEISDQFAGHLIWLCDEPMLPGRPYILKCGTQTVTASVTALKYQLQIDSLDHVAVRELCLNQIAMCNFSTNRPIVFAPYNQNQTLGAFIVIDRLSCQTVGAGMIQFGLRRARNVHRQRLDIDRSARAKQKGQRPFCLWFTGLSGSGKSTIANALDRHLFGLGYHTFVLDGDNVRHGLNRDLGFTDVDRVENIRRVAEVAKLMTEAGLITIVSFIAPFEAERRMARDMFREGEFLEVFIDAPLDVCEKRDSKGLYKRARAGEIKNFTGIDSSYEPPLSPDFHLKSCSTEVETLVDEVVENLRSRYLI